MVPPGLVDEKLHTHTQTLITTHRAGMLVLLVYQLSSQAEWLDVGGLSHCVPELRVCLFNCCCHICSDPLLLPSNRVVFHFAALLHFIFTSSSVSSPKKNGRNTILLVETLAELLFALWFSFTASPSFSFIQSTLRLSVLNTSVLFDATLPVQGWT